MFTNSYIQVANTFTIIGLFAESTLKVINGINGISEETRRSLKPVGARSGIMYRICKVRKDIINSCPAFRTILSAINTPTCKLAKFLLPILKSFSRNEYTVRTHLLLMRKLLNMILIFFLRGSQDFDSLFTNIPLKETIHISANTLFENIERVEGLSKIEFKQDLSKIEFKQGSSKIEFKQL